MADRLKDNYVKAGKKEIGDLREELSVDTYVLCEFLERIKDALLTRAN